ncbi:MAG: excinuclease ABC subunit UvrC, partial [Alphaproteobacteria bacterium]
PHEPGVYRMLDNAGKVLYIGKAKNLYKRVINYTQLDRLSHRIKNMVQQTASMEIVTTSSEAEALLLEANLIRNLQPRYNILLRDDKSFPYILLREDHPYSQATKYRGSKNVKGKYYGPFASVRDVNDTISHLQKIFFLRSCSDNYFENRKRPCMLYQIKRCSAPCVGKISQPDYQELVNQAGEFLSGKSSNLQKRLSSLMEEASGKLDYELAAIYRDRIKTLTNIQTKRDIANFGISDADVFALHQENGDCCVQVFLFRGGQHYGNKPYFPIHAEETESGEILAAFIGQFYQTRFPPKQIIVNYETPNSKSIEQALASIVNHKVQIIYPKSGKKLDAIKFATSNAKDALHRKLSMRSRQENLMLEVKKLFELEVTPKRIEVYDNSHIMGTHAIGGMIVANNEGFDKNSYRRFNISKSVDAKVITGGDDYAMLKEVLDRRLKRLLKEYPTYCEGIWPDIMMIDGGAGHLSTAAEIFKKYNIQDIFLVSISKGPDRNAGKEYFHTLDKKAFTLSRDEPVMKYLQRLRDEAHRYAIESHRKKRTMAISISSIDAIPGIGPKRKKALLNYFGSAKSIFEAKIEDLAKIESINKTTAKFIYSYLHGDE